jgi:Zn-dependent M28 family amino/carboxypeptidase
VNSRSRFGRAAAIAALAGGVALAGATSVPAQAEGTNNTSKKLRAAVTLEGLTEHLEAFQRIADENGGNRFSGLPGYDESVEYAVGVFEAAGYHVTIQPFTYLASAVLGPAILQQTAPGQVDYTEDVDYTYMSQTDPGNVIASVTAVDLQLGLGNTSTSGCEAADFAGFPTGHIALMQRGTCPFEDKVENAAAAGAVGALIMNQGDSADPSRTGLAGVTLGATNTSGIPALFTTYALGVELSQTAGLEMRIVTDTVREEKETYNVLAQSRWGNPDNVVMAGAHLDSVPEGPGINDNGTGSAGILEIAEQMQKVKPKNQVRFALWGAEESGLVGSHHYVDQLSEKEAAKIALYLNFDMIGSPNYVRFVYDGDNSKFPVGPGAAEGPAGSGEIEQLFHDYFASVGLASAETACSGRSDYGPFIEIGIPSGGLFTGAEGIKTAEEAAVFGGQAGIAYDPCYHQPCDDLSNVNGTGFEEMADAAAHAILTYAMDTRTVNGSGKGRPVSPPGQHQPGTPTGAQTGSGGGLHDHDHEGETH